MTEQEFTAKYSWVDPTLGYPNDTLREGVVKYVEDVAVSEGAAHKAIPFLDPIHSSHMEKIDGKSWEMFHATLRGVIDGQEYVWGMFIEGLGFINVMVPFEFIRPLTKGERAAWSKVTLVMEGSHTGKVSGIFESGVQP